MLKSIVLAAVALCVASAAHAADTAPAAQASDAPKKEKKVCREEGDTGSMIPRRTCHTPEEWQAIDAQTAQSTDRMNAMKHSSSGH